MTPTNQNPKEEKEPGGFFRFRELGDKILVTNDAGEYKFLDKDSFQLLCEGRLNEVHKDYLDLKSMGCVDSGGTPPRGSRREI